MRRVNITGFSGDLISVSEDIGDGVWRLNDENGDEFTLSNGELRELLPILEALVVELDLRGDD